MNLNDLLEAARKLGASDGRAAASWYFDTGRRDMTRADYQRVLTGLNDIDPEIMDSLPSSPLSGEFADDRTPMKLYEEIGVTELQLRNWESSGELDDIIREYEDAYSASVTDAVESECHTALEQDVVFTLTVKTEQDPAQLLSKLFDLLAAENCSIEEDEFEII